METKKENEVKERIAEFCLYKQITVAEFQNSIGVSNSYVQNIVNSVGVPVLRRITAKYPELNQDWLLKGSGSMVKEDTCVTSSKMVCVLPIYATAQAGTLSDFTVQVSSRDCEKMVSPIKDADLAITVTGDSMSPEYPNGSKVLVKRIKESAFIIWGATFVLDTCNGVVIKNVYPGSSEGMVRCVSINKNYPDFEVCIGDIYGWYRVLMCLSLK